MSVLSVRPLAELVDGDPLIELDACWDAAWAAMASPADTALLAICQKRMADLLSYPAGPAASTEAATDQAVAAGLALTEQYLIDVSSATAQQIDALAAQLDGSVVDFVTALLVVEQRMRLELGLSRVLGDGTKGAADPVVAPPAHPAPTRVPVRPSTPARAPSAPDATRDRELGAALLRFAAAAVRNDGVDPVTTELVRLRCATYHDCHT